MAQHVWTSLGSPRCVCVLNATLKSLDLSAFGFAVALLFVF